MRTNDHVANILTKRKLSTMQRYSLLTLWRIRRPNDSNDVRSFSRTPLALAQLQAMFQVMTQTESVDEMWDPYSSKVFEASCVLENHLTLDQLSNHEFSCKQYKRNVVAGVLFALTAEGNLMQVTSSEMLRNQRVCETIRFLDGDLSKMHECFQIPFYVQEKMNNEQEIKFNKRWNDYLEHYMESARSILGQRILFIVHSFLVAKRTR